MKLFNFLFTCSLIFFVLNCLEDGVQAKDKKTKLNVKKKLLAGKLKLLTTKKKLVLASPFIKVGLKKGLIFGGPLIALGLGASLFDDSNLGDISNAIFRRILGIPERPIPKPYKFKKDKINHHYDLDYVNYPKGVLSYESNDGWTGSSPDYWDGQQFYNGYYMRGAHSNIAARNRYYDQDQSFTNYYSYWRQNQQPRSNVEDERSRDQSESLDESHEDSINEDSGYLQDLTSGTMLKMSEKEILELKQVLHDLGIQNGEVPEFTPFPGKGRGSSESEEEVEEMQASESILLPSGSNAQNMSAYIHEFFTLVNNYDNGTCFEKLICDIHSKVNEQEENLSSYEKGLTSIFRMLEVVESEESIASDPLASKYRAAARFGKENGSPEKCANRYPLCPVTSEDIIETQRKLENLNNDEK